MRRTALVIGVLLVSPLACNPGSAKSSALPASSTSAVPQSEDHELDALMQTSRDWAQAAASRDIERILSYWADDAIVMEPDQRALFGKAAIRGMVEASMKIPKFSITWGPETGVISKDGTMGYLIEHNRVSFPDSTGKVQTQFGKAVTIWRKDANGAWKCVVDTWNANPTSNVYPAV
jgi:ketosteroid isomerase-like protein